MGPRLISGLLALVVLIGGCSALVGCGDAQIPKGDDKPPAGREGMPTPPGDK
ncbi:MAG: hypothetical protein KIS66_10890 [Fimbriimonadaceae bacterium]|nr:hypothetical protein [Fimbriimonadaceae bacterium]